MRGSDCRSAASNCSCLCPTPSFLLRPASPPLPSPPLSPSPPFPFSVPPWARCWLWVIGFTAEACQLAAAPKQVRSPVVALPFPMACSCPSMGHRRAPGWACCLLLPRCCVPIEAAVPGPAEGARSPVAAGQQAPLRSVDCWLSHTLPDLWGLGSVSTRCHKGVTDCKLPPLEGCMQRCMAALGPIASAADRPLGNSVGANGSVAGCLAALRPGSQLLETLVRVSYLVMLDPAPACGCILCRVGVKHPC